MGVAVVTGGTAGVGRAVVRELATRGFDVAVLARGEPGLAGAVADVEQQGRRGSGLSVDVADYDGVLTAAERVECELGAIDVWVNCAFAGFLAPFEQVTMQEFHRVTEVTYHGYVHGTRAALQQMRPRDKGVIVQVGSALAYRGIPLQSAYCGAKHAIVGFTESVRTELLHDKSKVSVCMVQLPALNTPQFSWVLSRMGRHPQPVPPIYQPEVAARAVVHAALHPRRNMWVGTTTALTILGGRLAPRVLDTYLARTGYDAQQAQEPLPSMDPPNLFHPVEVDHGSHGVFDDRAHERSGEAWLSMHRGQVAAGAAGVAAAAAGVTAVLSRRR